MLELFWVVLRRTLRLMLPTSFRQSCPVPPPDDDAVPAPSPLPWPATVASCWPVTDDADDDFFEGLRSRLDRRLGVPRPPKGVPDADTVVLSVPATDCCPAAKTQLPLGLVLLPPPPPLPPLPPLDLPPHVTTERADRPVPPPPLLNRRTRPRMRPLLRAVGPSSTCSPGASTLWLN